MKRFTPKLLTLAVVAVTGMMAGLPAQAYESPLHIFSIDDIQGGFDGSTYGPHGAIQDTGIICTVGCENMIDKEGVTLYPIDSEFGFDVVDFLGAEGMVRDGDYAEGYAGNITDGDTIVGVKISNAETDFFKVKAPLGTWCKGLGGNSVKCSTEHYSVLEHVLSCHEVIPYMYADPETGEQSILTFPSGSESFDCTNAGLNNELWVLEDGLVAGTFPDVPLDPNDNTTVMNDIAFSSDYSITLKDDGKVLYRWGGMIKRPRDVRLYARLALPNEWKVEGAPDYPVTKAELHVTHWITNNPNDQLRPEDLENEAATGRKPGAKVIKVPNADGVTFSKYHVSARDCYEGDGDVLTGDVEPTFLPAGTVLRNYDFGYETTTYGHTREVPPSYPLELSADLTKGYTNAWYTSINRDPFEWSYLILDGNGDGVIERNLWVPPGVTDDDDAYYTYVGTSAPLSEAEMAEQGLRLVSGPRWRLKANKFGQDIPGLEIPAEECSPPPFQHDNLKYEVGTLVTTVINLLDWDPIAKGAPSPLSTSHGWLTPNEFVTIVGETNGVPITSNGLPMTEDFDLAVYIKGDRKPTALYNAKLVIEYEGETEPPPTTFDVAITDIASSDEVVLGDQILVYVSLENLGPAATATGGSVNLSCVDNRDRVFETEHEFPVLADEATYTADFGFPTSVFNPQDDQPLSVKCAVDVLIPDDVNLLNNGGTFSVKVKKP